MPADRTLLPLAIGLLLCCLLCPRSEALPSPPTQSTKLTSSPTPTPPHRQSNPFATTGPLVESIFTLPEVCPYGYKLTGNPPHCHKLV